jgi:antitoxin (DNA-binding transcriptional repressor) of toxin-antitoxin stability system
MMNETPISVTAAARNFSDCINRVRYQGTSFVLEKNGVAVARIVPVTSISVPDVEILPAPCQGHPEEATREQLIELPCNLDEESKLNPEQVRSKRPALNW